MANANDRVEPTPQIEDNPSPQISGGQGGQSYEQAGGKSVDFSAILDSPEFDAYIEKKVQSKQDARLGKYGTRLDSLEGALSKYESLLAGGMSKEQAVDKMRLDQEIADLKAAVSGQAQVEPSAGTGAKPWTEREASILEQAGVAKNDRRLSDLLRSRTFSSHDEYISVLEQEAFNWKQADAKKPQPTTATVAQTAPSLPVGDGTYTKDKYVNDMLAARGNKAELARIKAAARADGVDVDNIGFT